MRSTIVFIFVLLLTVPAFAKSPSKEDKKNAEKLFDEGVKLGNEKKLEEAEQTFMKVIKLDETHVAAYENLALLFLMKHKYDAVIPVALAAIHLDPKRPRAYYRLGKALYNEHMFEAAIPFLEEAANLDKKNKITEIKDSLYFAGTAYMKLQHKEKALELLSKASEIDKTNHLLFFNMASIYQKDKEWEKMATALEQAVKANPKYGKGFYFLGRAYHKMNNIKKAATAFENACALGIKKACN